MKMKMLPLAAVCVLLLLGTVAVYWLVSNREQALPVADGSQIMIVSNGEARIDGKLGWEQIEFNIPKDADLFTEYSNLLSSLGLRHCIRKYEMGEHYYMIIYTSGTPGDSKGVRILFNEDAEDCYVHVTITQNGEDASIEGGTYKVENMEAWKEALLELLGRSEEYKEN